MKLGGGQTITKSSQVWPVVFFMLVATVFSAMGVVYSSFETRRLIGKYQELQSEEYSMQVEWGQLLLEQSTWGSFKSRRTFGEHKAKHACAQSK